MTATLLRELLVVQQPECVSKMKRIKAVAKVSMAYAIAPLAMAGSTAYGCVGGCILGGKYAARDILSELAIVTSNLKRELTS